MDWFVWADLRMDLAELRLVCVASWDLELDRQTDHFFVVVRLVGRQMDQIDSKAWLGFLLERPVLDRQTDLTVDLEDVGIQRFLREPVVGTVRCCRMNQRGEGQDFG